MAITLFELLAKLSLDANEFNAGVAAATASGQKLKGELEGTTQSASKLALDIADSIGRSIGTIFGNLITSIPQFLSATVEAARDMEAERAKYNSVFSDDLSGADAAFERLSEYSGAYYTRLRGEGADFYAQFKAGGMDSAQAMTTMEQSMMLAADAAAFYDISLEDASQRLRSFLRGNVEAGESIGLFATDISRTNKSMELFGAKWTALTEAQRELVLLSIAQDAYNATNATGQASREADNYANKLENIKAIWHEIQATIGGPILDAITPVIEKFEEFLKSNPEFVQDFSEALGSIAGTLSDWIISLMDWLIANSDVILDFVASIAGYLGIIPRNTGPGRLANEDYGGRTLEETYGSDETDRDLNTTATAAIDNIISALDIFLEAASEYNRSGTEETESAMMDAYDALADLLTQDQYDALNAWIDSNGIGDYEKGEYVPYGGYEIPDELLNVLTGLPGEVGSAVVSGLTGVGIQLDGQIVGTIIAPKIMDIMARKVRNA